MAVSLSKGQKVDLTKGNASLSNIHIGLGWDVNKYDGNADFDLDASLFILNAQGKVSSDEDFIFYNNLTGGNGSIVHQGDNRTGDGDGDDEVITIDLPNVPANIHKIAVTVTIDDAEARQQSFGQITNAYVRIVDMANDTELVHFDLGEDFSIETAIVAGEVYRHNGEWKFAAVGAGYQGGLRSLCLDYGVNV